MRTPVDYTVGVLGGGPVGSVLALGLAGLGYRVQLFERNFAATTTHRRTLVLSQPTITLLANLGIDCQALPGACPIATVKLRRYASMWGCSFDARHRRGKWFGVALAQQQLQAALDARLDAVSAVSGIVSKHQSAATASGYDAQGRVCCTHGDGGDRSSFDLLAIADGSNSASLASLGIAISSAPQQDQALVGELQLAHSLDDCAYELFDQAAGITCVLVPRPECTATLIVLGRPGMAWPDTHWLHQRLGDLVKIVGHRQLASFVLQEQLASELIRPRVAVFGNAAFTMHPLAAQGLNLAYKQCSTFFHLLSGGNPAFGSDSRVFDRDGQAFGSNSRVFNNAGQMSSSSNSRASSGSSSTLIPSNSPQVSGSNTQVSGNNSPGNPGEWSRLRRFETLAIAQQHRARGLVNALRRVHSSRLLLSGALIAAHNPLLARLLVKAASAPPLQGRR